MLFNYTGFNTFTGFMTFFNNVTSGWFWTLTVFALFIIVVLIFMNYRMEDSILASGFVTAVYCVMLRIMHLVPDAVVVIFILITALLSAFKFLFTRK
jgi:hypothetical protein